MGEVNFSLMIYSLMFYTIIISILYLNNIQETTKSSSVHELLGQPSYKKDNHVDFCMVMCISHMHSTLIKAIGYVTGLIQM